MALAEGYSNLSEMVLNTIKRYIGIVAAILTYFSNRRYKN